MFKFRKKQRRKRGFDGMPETVGVRPETKRAIATIIIFTVAFLMILSFIDGAGDAGQALEHAMRALFGRADFIIPVLLLIMGYFLLRPTIYQLNSVKYIGLTFIILATSGLFHLSTRNLPLEDIIVTGTGGGYIGYGVGNFLYSRMAIGGALIALTAFTLVGLFLFFNASFAGVGVRLAALRERMRALRGTRQPRESTDSDVSLLSPSAFTTQSIGDEEDDHVDDEAMDDEAPAIITDDSETDLPQKPLRRKPLPKIDLPIDLLTSSTDLPSSGDIKANMKKIETTLSSFGIPVTMGEVTVGPTVTQYTLKPTEGVKLTQITTLQNDLSLSLAAHPIRIEAPIPGKSLVGIEVPNQTVSIVKLRDVLQGAAYINRSSNLMIALGKDVTGKVMMANLAKMPHLLIAGATGSGKSVAINSMLVGLLYQNSADILKIILVDPKRVELSVYDGIPHLITPVITEVDKTINALRWAVNQMDERYKLLAASGKRNIDSYNAARLVDKMPYIVIIIDELADLMAVAAKEVEAAIIRLAQMARAVGIHLILATQRPSVNVITGLIKANITSRIAFSVASNTDSRTIIDMSGAEKLLGNGDMLFISAELSKPKRIQGAFISEQEVANVANYLREKGGEPQYDSDVVERKRSTMTAGSSFESDTEERDIRTAAELVIKAKRASATLLQSRMRVGFAKASRLLDLLEERGIIGPQNSSKAREVLISETELKESYGEDTSFKEGFDISNDDEQGTTDDTETTDETPQP